MSERLPKVLLTTSMQCSHQAGVSATVVSTLTAPAAGPGLLTMFPELEDSAQI
jgi:hypothetical protein